MTIVIPEKVSQNNDQCCKVGKTKFHLRSSCLQKMIGVVQENLVKSKINLVWPKMINVGP